MKALIVENLHKSYGNHKVISDVSLEINRGELIALVGPNGSGKSTFLNTISNIINADYGRISILGKDHKDISIYHTYSYMMDNTLLYPYLSGLDHLKFVCDTRKLNKDALRNVLELMGIKSFVKKKIKDYSLGMKQQLLFAMAIVNNPDFLVLDEPFNGLDPTMTIKVRNIIKDLQKKGTTILLSSHNLSEVDQMTSHIVFLKDGQFIEEDISKYQEDVYYISTREEITELNGLSPQLFQIREKEIQFTTHKISLQDALNKISALCEITNIRNAYVGSERRYEEIFGS